MTLPDVVMKYREKATKSELEIADLVWQRKDEFVRWPPDDTQDDPMFPGWVRTTETGYHVYTKEDCQRLKEAKIARDGRSNGPAIAAFLMACLGRPCDDCRPLRSDGRHQWSVHHIDDGRFPAVGSQSCLHAVKDGKHFTNPVGLVAIHPIADALADEIGYFAWLLRWEAHSRFGYDPNEVFSQGCRLGTSTALASGQR